MKQTFSYNPVEMIVFLPVSVERFKVKERLILSGFDLMT